MVREKWYFIFTRKIHTASVLNPAGIGFSHSYPWHVASLNAAKMMSFYSCGHKGLKFILKEFCGFAHNQFPRSFLPIFMALCKVIFFPLSNQSTKETLKTLKKTLKTCISMI